MTIWLSLLLEILGRICARLDRRRHRRIARALARAQILATHTSSMDMGCATTCRCGFWTISEATTHRDMRSWSTFFLLASGAPCVRMTTPYHHTTIRLLFWMFTGCQVPKRDTFVLIPPILLCVLRLQTIPPRRHGLLSTAPARLEIRTEH